MESSDTSLSYLSNSDSMHYLSLVLKNICEFFSYVSSSIQNIFRYRQHLYVLLQMNCNIQVRGFIIHLFQNLNNLNVSVFILFLFFETSQCISIHYYTYHKFIKEIVKKKKKIHIPKTIYICSISVDYISKYNRYGIIYIRIVFERNEREINWQREPIIRYIRQQMAHRKRNLASHLFSSSKNGTLGCSRKKYFIVNDCKLWRV